jgi:hypothetical protein
MRPTWKSQQQREQTAAQEAPDAPPTAAAVFGMDGGDDEDQGEVTDDVFDDAGPDHPGGTIGEPESEPEIEPGTPGAKAEPEVGLEDDDSDDEVADHDKGLPVDAAAPALPVLQQEPRPSLESYTKKWAGLLAQHSKAVVGEFSASNLVPLPIHVLWQALRTHTRTNEPRTRKNTHTRSLAVAGLPPRALRRAQDGGGAGETVGLQAHLGPPGIDACWWR